MQTTNERRLLRIYLALALMIGGSGFAVLFSLAGWLAQMVFLALWLIVSILIAMRFVR